MLKNYIRIAIRSLARHRLYGFINAFGLSTGIAFCVLIFLYIRDEQSFDQWHTHKDYLYRMEGRSYDTWRQESADPYNTMAWLQTGLGPALKADLAEVKYASRYNADYEGTFRYGDKVFMEKATYVDPDFFRMFTFKILKGNADKLFKSAAEVVLTEQVARRYFGDEEPLGKTIEFENEGKKLFTVTAIIESPPANSSLTYNLLLPQENKPYYERGLTQWGNFNTPTFVMLQPGTDLTLFKRNLDQLATKYFGDKMEKWRKNSTVPIPADAVMFEYLFTPLAEIHMKKEVSWRKVSDPKYSWILGGIAFLILTIACVNYILLALTTSAARRTEVGIRKTVGAQQSQLISQFTIESLALALISMVFAMVLVVTFLPFFNDFTEKGIELNWSNVPMLLGASLVTTVLVGILAGGYPAFYLSRFRPALVLKGIQTRMNAGATRYLVVAQFTLSAVLIICSVIMNRQMEYITTKDLGYDRDQLLVIQTQTGWNKEADKTAERFRARAAQEPFITGVAGTTASFNKGISQYGYKINDEQKAAYVYGVDAHYITTLGLMMVEGRNFDPAIPSDTLGVIVNEALVKDMKWEHPLEEHLNWREDSVGLGSPVIGVVKDYHYLSLEENIEPMFLSMNKKDVGYLTAILVKLKAGELTGAVDKLKTLWKEVAPDRPFECSFVDEDVAAQYASYKRWTNLSLAATGFAIMISCLGLFGLAGINTLNRRKEIGVRKAMGAGSSSIVVMMSKPYLWMSFISFLLAAPASWYLMGQWLEGFKFRIALHWELFAFSVLAGLVLALLTVSYHTFRAAAVNPADTLRYE
ncbi:MAG TPA: ABC transporter permease [Cyclobacteriaceae bacterium]|nr:ABC transporter permease [Cyclobacteriaceae bacterium]